MCILQDEIPLLYLHVKQNVYLMPDICHFFSGKSTGFK